MEINYEAEFAALGAAILDNRRALPYICSHLEEDDFVSNLNRRVFGNIKDCVESGEAVDFVTLSTRMEADGWASWSEDGATDYLFSVCKDHCPTPINYRDYVKLIQQARVVRRLKGEVDGAIDAGDVEAISEMATKLGIDHTLESVRVTTLSNAEPVDAEFLWDPYFPLKQVTDLSGPENSGKSRFLLAALSWMSKGRLPTGEECDPVSVIYVSSEDESHSLKRVIEEYGGDPAMFHHVSNCGPLTPAWQTGIAQAVKAHNAKVVIFDPIMEYLPQNVAMNEFSQPIVQQFMASQKRKIAQAANCSLVHVRHFSKASDKPSEKGGGAVHHGQRGSGSRTWTTKARSGLEFEKVPFESSKDPFAIVRHTRGSMIRGSGSKFIFYPYKYQNPFDFEADPNKLPQQFDDEVLQLIYDMGDEVYASAVHRHLEDVGCSDTKAALNSMVKRGMIVFEKVGEKFVIKRKEAKH